MIVQNRHQKPLHPLSHQRPESIWEVRSTAVQKLLERYCTKSPCDFWHPPEPHWKVEEEPHKKPKKGGDKSAVAFFEKCTKVGLRIS